MRQSPVRRRLLLLALALVASSCGGGAPDRPVIVDAYPADGAVLPTPLGVVRVRFDAPVRLLNPAQVSAAQEAGSIAVAARLDPADPTVLYVEPLPGWSFRPGRAVVVIGAGLVVNEDDQYALEDVALDFTVGRADTLFAARPASGDVVAVDATTFTAVATVDTPLGRAPTGIATTNLGGSPRVWVQLATGGAAGEALAFFPPGATSMATVPLSQAPASQLLATVSALWAPRRGDVVYAAYRDEALGQVRLAAVDARTATEVGTLVLSPTAGPSTRPLGLTGSPDGTEVHVVCRSPDGDFLVRVDAASLTEVDLGDPAAGLGLPVSGGGPAAQGDDEVLIAPAEALFARLLAVASDTLTVVEHPSDVEGRPATLARTPDGLWVVEGLTAFVADEMLVARPQAALDEPETLTVSDRTPSGPGSATAVRALAVPPDENRLYVFLDDDVLVVFTWTEDAWIQDDLHPETLPVDGADLSGVAAGTGAAAFLVGARP